MTQEGELLADRSKGKVLAEALTQSSKREKRTCHACPRPRPSIHVRARSDRFSVDRIGSGTCHGESPHEVDLPDGSSLSLIFIRLALFPSHLHSLV